ncbi:energy transducer TonB [uncultured Helicobacter sp.]|uniref:energy transducer TonB n=1 Tax=uncultured Helicobacter sp. TaxID=175537 RepID=UPI002637FF2C|nr:energy transducer TonB [uncultured Helicobacter sp.]
MKRNSFLALFLSLAIHFLLFALLLWELRVDDFYRPQQMGVKEGERVSLKHFRFSQGGENQKRENVESQISKPTPPNPPQKQDSKSQVQPKPKQPKPAPPKQNKPPKPSVNNALAQSLSKPQPQRSVGALDSPSIYDFGKDMSNQEVKDLYGEEFGSLDAEQKRFIKDNLSGIGRITQRYLKYPSVAGRMGQQGDNIVEFYLYPNGDISDLKLLTPSGFRLLDENSIHTIKIAYKDYPYPSVKTKIRIRVMYRIY